MLLCGDVDLVRIEPNLFGAVGWFGQRLSRGTGTIAGTTLSATGLDVGFDVAGVGAESVAMVGGVACEVIARVSANVLTVSRVRGEGVVELTPPSPVTGVEVALWTMRPQIAIVSSQVFRMLGLSVSPGTGEARLVEPQTLRTFAALWTLAKYRVVPRARFIRPQVSEVSPAVVRGPLRGFGALR